MARYVVGRIYTRCFVQREMAISPEIAVEPLPATRHKGSIFDGKDLLERAGHPITRKVVEQSLANAAAAGAAVCIRFRNIEAADAPTAMKNTEAHGDVIAGALSVLSVNPAVPLVTFCSRSDGSDGAIHWEFPNDPIISHGTNIPGYLDVVPALVAKALVDPKVALLLSLYRASQREPDADKKMLFQLILLEEASDVETGTLAARLTSFFVKHGVLGDFDAIAAQAGLELPAGKTLVDALVKLRNSAAHNGEITEQTLRDGSAEWLIPLIANKDGLHRLVGEAIRYTLAVLAGHSRDLKALAIELRPGEQFEVRFDDP